MYRNKFAAETAHQTSEGIEPADNIYELGIRAYGTIPGVLAILRLLYPESAISAHTVERGSCDDARICLQLHNRYCTAPVSYSTVPRVHPDLNPPQYIAKMIAHVDREITERLSRISGDGGETV